jgi:hypothetical protein
MFVTTPGVPASGELARRIARESNEYAAKLAADHGAASAPLPVCPWTTWMLP